MLAKMAVLSAVLGSCDCGQAIVSELAHNIPDTGSVGPGSNQQMMWHALSVVLQVLFCV
jgi:hypothetical protein